MRKIRLNSGLSSDMRRRILQDVNLISANLDFVQRAVAVNDTSIGSIKEALAKASATMIALENYVGSKSVNSARLPVGGEQDDVDAEFLDNADSILGLEDGQSIDLSKAQLLYNEDTMELVLTDEDEVPDGYAVVGVVEETPATDNSNEDEDDDGEAKEPEDAEAADKETTDDASAEEQPAAPKAESESPAEESEEF